MLELASTRKNKISLADYDFEQDLYNRMLMSEFNVTDVMVLEEILFHSLQIPIPKLLKNLDIDSDSLKKSLELLVKTKLFSIENDTLIVDKEMRKYYESQIIKFDEDFKPGIEFIQGVLRKVPIHLLPIWYSISRTSNNIFNSIAEKYFETPLVFQRYLKELTFDDQILCLIVDDVYNSEDLELPASTIMEKYSLSREQFEESMLLLEFNMVCFLQYRKNGERYEEVVSTFHEWKEYTQFLKNSAPISIENPVGVIELDPRPFGFVDDLSSLLNYLRENPLPVTIDHAGNLSVSESALSRLTKELSLRDEKHLYNLIAKLRSFKFADLVDSRLYALENGSEWLDLSLDNRAIYIYRYHLTSFDFSGFPQELLSHRSIREAEKSISRIANTSWIYLSDFLKSLTVALNDRSTILLRKVGRNWKYSLPEYTEEEYRFVSTIVTEWLFEVGFITKGVHQGKECIKATTLGRTLFSV